MALINNQINNISKGFTEISGGFGSRYNNTTEYYLDMSKSFFDPDTGHIQAMFTWEYQTYYLHIYLK